MSHGGRTALLIGVPEYSSPTIPPLPVVRTDIELLQAALEGSSYDVRSIGLGDLMEVSLSRIKQSVRHACLTAPPGGTLVLAFSGHGFHDGQDFLVPSCAVIEEPLRDYLIPIDFAAWFDSSPAQTIIFFVDACREGLEIAKSLNGILRWSQGKRDAASKRETALVFSCGPGQQSRFVKDESGQGFSLFSKALAEILSPEHTAQTFEEVITALQDRLDALAKQHGKPQQQIRVLTEHGVEDRIRDRVICNGVKLVSSAPMVDPWVQAARDSTLWEAVTIATHPLVTDAIELVEAAADCRRRAAKALGTDPWVDDAYPSRTVRRLEVLVRLAKDVTLGAAEAALLVASPFIGYAAILSALAAGFLDAAPESFDGMPGASSLRLALEREHLSRPQLVRKARSLHARGDLESCRAVASWLLQRTVRRRPETWSAVERGGTFSPEIEAKLASLSPLGADVFRRNRLLALSRCDSADVERIERSGHDDSLQPGVHVGIETKDEQLVRERLLAWLLALAGRMSIDIATLPEVIVDHVGLRDPIEPSKVRSALDVAKWIPAAGGRSYQLHCEHPALDLALRDHIETLDWLLREALDRAREKVDHLDALDGIPHRLTTRDLKPVKVDGRPAYDTPHTRFELAAAEVRELLMNEQLYGDPTLAIRELYQNALDACRYRRARTEYLQRVGEYAGDPWEGRIEFEQGKTPDGRPYIECRDNGIGMGQRELSQAFARAGRRFTDLPEFIEEQSRWAQLDPPVELFPNSQFGVGVFSYFMLADELEIETCRLDRSGRPGPSLTATISGSGSLFRVQPNGQGKASGTRIRLFLSRTTYREREGGSSREVMRTISCLTTLRHLLWVAEFPTIVVDGSGQHEWLPGVLVGPKQDNVIPGSQPSIWWTSERGRLLSDGILTDVQPKGHVVDLRGRHRPQLTVDRKGVSSYDQAYVRRLLRMGADAFASLPMPSWMSFDWLWTMAKVDAVACDRIVTLLDGTRPLVAQRKVSAPLAAIGTFPPDEDLFEAFDRVRSHLQSLGGMARSLPYSPKRDEAYHQEALEKVMNFLLGLPGALRVWEAPSSTADWTSDIAYLLRHLTPEIWLWRIRVWATHFKIPDDVSSRLPAFPLVTITACSAEFVSERVVDRASFSNRKISIAAVIAVSARLQVTYEKALEHASFWAHFGFKLPIVDLADLADQLPSEIHLILLSKNLDGAPPWLEHEIPPGHLVAVAAKLQLGYAQVLAQASVLARLGFQLPAIDIDRENDIHVSDALLVLLSRTLNGRGPWLSREVTLAHIVRAAAKLMLTTREAYERAKELARLGLTLPDVDLATMPDFQPTDGHLTLLSALPGDLERKASWFHIVQAAGIMKCTISAVLELAQPFRDMGLAIESPPEGFDSAVVVTTEDLRLLSRDFDAAFPWMEQGVPMAHLHRASTLFGRKPAAIRRRLKRLGIRILDTN